MSWQHTKKTSPELTRDELERIVSLCGSDPSLESIRVKAEESLSAYMDRDRLLEQARIREEERKSEEIRSERQFLNEALWTIFQNAPQSP